MTRLIKFRQWNKSTKSYTYWGYLEHGFSTPTISRGVSLDTPNEQFTGLLDKNGTPIYEGDLVKETHHNGTTARYIFWNEPTAQFCMRISEQSPALVLDMYLCAELEVIGNLYENPDLLKAEER